MPVATRDYWLVRRGQPTPSEPVMVFRELRDGVESRRVEFWLDGRRGFASSQVSVGETTHGTSSGNEFGPRRAVGAGNDSGLTFEATYRVTLA